MEVLVEMFMLCVMIHVSINPSKDVCVFISSNSRCCYIAKCTCTSSNSKGSTRSCTTARSNHRNANIHACTGYGTRYCTSDRTFCNVPAC